MKSFFKFAAVFFIILFSLFIGRNLIAKTVVESAVHLVTGLRLNIGSLDIGARNPSLGIKELKLFNPGGYPDKVMLDLPEFFVAYEIAPLFKGKVHLPEVRIYLKEFVVVKNKKGEVNLNALKPVQDQKKEAKPSAEKLKEAGKTPQIQIDHLDLRVEKVVYKDYASGDTPSIKEFKVNLNESYSNITDPAAVVSLIVVKALMNTSVASLTDVDLGLLKASVSDTLATSQKLATDAILKTQTVIDNQAKAAQELAGKAPQSLKQAVGSVSGTAGEITKSLTSTAGSLKEKLKSVIQ